MSFSSIIGLEQPIAVLSRAIQSGRVSHAYLFHGPPSIGKTLLAREFAKTLNCEATLDGSVDCCDVCSSCTRIDRDAHPDVHLVRPLAKVQADEEDGGADVVIEGALITTDQIKDVVVDANLKATQARRKVFIISCAEAMNPQAANRLLKTLEEPPPGTTLVLTTQNLSTLLPTILSRCQMIKCQPPALSEAGMALIARYPERDPGLIRSVVALSGGRIGWALNLLQHPAALELRNNLLDTAASLPKRDWFEGMALGEKLIQAAEEWWLATEESEFAEKALKASRDRVCRTRMNEVLNILLTWFRDLALLTSGGPNDLLINADRSEQLAAVASRSSLSRVSEACRDIEQARREFRGNANLRLTAEVLAFKLIRASR
ncbi:MAG: DNA polymerase III subunit delta' [Armatimonadetes bacterium]|nr:DNA polymerase III subunit delta' [Armatimonadota bacterium]